MNIPLPYSQKQKFWNLLILILYQVLCTIHFSKCIFLRMITSFAVPSTITEDNISSTNPKCIADAFSNYFSNMATSIKSSIKYSRNKFFDFLPQIDINSFFINPTDKTETKNIILSLYSLKSIGPNSIPTKILKLLSNDISTQLAKLFNSSFLKVLSHQY